MIISGDGVDLSIHTCPFLSSSESLLFLACLKVVLSLSMSEQEKRYTDLFLCFVEKSLYPASKVNYRTENNSVLLI